MENPTNTGPREVEIDVRLSELDGHTKKDMKTTDVRSANPPNQADAQYDRP